MARKTQLAWLAALLTALSLGCKEAPTSPQSKSDGPRPEAGAPKVETGKADVEANLDELPDVVERALPSVVGVATKRTIRMAPSPFMNPFMTPFGQPQPLERQQEGMGSGVIVSKEGVILTNNHVVAGADEIRVSLWDKRELDAKVLGTDPKSDVAVLEIINPPDDLVPMPFGDSDAIRLGETVVAIGNPFGLSSTVTMGIVSAKGRANVGILDYEDFIQTDAAINPGNSGGALINMRGELIGINSAILSRSGGNQGIAFAIPSNMARSIQDSLVQDGKVTRGWLGVMIQTLDKELAEALGADPKLEGVVVSDVQKGSPAEEAGLQRGDVIVKIGDRKIANATQLRNYVAMQKPGETVNAEIVRNGATKSVPVKLGELGGEAQLGQVDAVDGLQLAPVDPEFRARFRVPENLEGLAVQSVEPGSMAARMGFRPGDVILEVNRRKVKHPADFKPAYDSTSKKALFLIFREGATLFIATPKP